MQHPEAERFVQESLASCRRETIESSLRSKLRGRKLLLERSKTVAAGEGVEQRRPKGRRAAAATRGGGAAPPRRRQRHELLERAVREVSFEQLQRQHERWAQYALSVLSDAPSSRVGELAERLDRHGAPARVVRSASAAHASAEGLLLAETRRMLVLLSASRLAWVPKEGTTIEVRLPGGLPPVRLEGLALRLATEQTGGGPADADVG